MKEFMMIFLGAKYEEQNLSSEELQTRMQTWFTWIGKLKEQGIYLGGDPLTYDVKRISGPDRIESDGPFVETKEIIGGYFKVKANNFDEVKAMAKDYPDYDLGGTVEIREIMKF